MRQLRKSQLLRNYPFQRVIPDTPIKQQQFSLSNLAFKPKSMQPKKRPFLVQSERYENISYSDFPFQPPKVQNNLQVLPTQDRERTLLLKNMITKIFENEVTLQHHQIILFIHETSKNFYGYLHSDNISGQCPVSRCCECPVYVVLLMSSQSFYLMCSQCNKELYRERPERPISRAKSSASIKPIKYQIDEFGDKAIAMYRIKNSSRQVSRMIQSGKYRRVQLTNIVSSNPQMRLDQSDQNEDIKDLLEIL